MWAGFVVFCVSSSPCNAVYLVLEGTQTAQLPGRCKWSPPTTDLLSYTIWDNQDEPLFLQSLKIALWFGKFHLAMLQLCNTYSKKLFIVKAILYMRCRRNCHCRQNFRCLLIVLSFAHSLVEKRRKWCVVTEYVYLLTWKISQTKDLTNPVSQYILPVVSHLFCKESGFYFSWISCFLYNFSWLASSQL